jgi:alpha-L-fucosidase
MRYVVFTTRHHNGFSMFDTGQSDHNIMHSAYGRDIVRDVADAFRAEGLRIGFYYSLSDWHHPDYPAFREEHKPYFPGISPPLPTDEQADRFRGYMFGQLRELLTGYGPIDVLWFDGQWERSPRWWRVDEIAALARELQPGILINDRLPGQGDFLTPEQFVPPTAPGERWETCFTMNDSWGWNPDDANYKSPRAIVHALCETAGRGGNLLLNVSPRGDGALPPEQIERLGAVTAWMADHHTAIHGTEAGLEPWQFYGPSTRRDDRIHLMCLMKPYDTVTVRGLPVRRVERVTVLGTGTPLGFTTRTGVLEQLTPDPDGEVTITVPERDHDRFATVLAVDLVAEPIAGRTPIGVVEADS